LQDCRESKLQKGKEKGFLPSLPAILQCAILQCAVGY